MQEELVDRFGTPPEPAQALIACHRLRLVAKPMGVAKVDAGPERTTLQFVKEPPFDPASLIALVRNDGRIRFAGPDRIRIERAAPTLAERVALVREFLGRLRVNGSTAVSPFPAADSRLRPRLAVVEQHPAQEPRRPRADRLGLRAHAPLTLALLASERGLGDEPLALARQHALPLRPRRRQRGDRAAIRLPDRGARGGGAARRALGREGAALRLLRPARRALRRRSRALPPGSTHVWGDLEWQALAAPGHDMGALVFYNAEHGILISGDALWENGFGFVMPPEIDPARAAGHARDARHARGASTSAVVIPGHGEPFTDGCRRRSSARGTRSRRSTRDSLRVARHALKVNLMFALLERQRMALADLPAYVERVGLYRDFNALLLPPAADAACRDAGRRAREVRSGEAPSRALSRRLGRDFARMADPRIAEFGKRRPRRAE